MKNIQQSLAILTEKHTYSELIQKLLHVIIETGDFDVLTRNNILQMYGIRRISDIKNHTLDVIIDFALLCLEDGKLTEEEIKDTEDLVNKWIKEDYPVTIEEMSKDEALKSGAECRFIEKYPDVVTVYSIGDFSKELCGGPHVEHTGELSHFVIKKEQSNGSGVRRIKAILEDK